MKERELKRMLISVLIVFLLCLGFAPALTSTSYVSAPSPTAKITLSPFLHITNSTVGALCDGIGYIDSVVTINNGVLSGTYTNTTEIQNTTTTYRLLSWISVYGSSQITINNTNMSSLKLYAYGSSQLTLINSTLDGVCTYDSSEAILRNNSKVQIMTVYNNSRVYLSESQVAATFTSFHNSYLNVSNSTIDELKAADFSTMQISNNCIINTFNATGFSTGQITNSTITTLLSFDAANITVDNSTISTVLYGLVCTGESLTIFGNTATGLSNCRNTTTLRNCSYTTLTLKSVCAIANSNVNITNNNTIANVVARASSKVYLENTTATMLEVMCTDHSNAVYKNSQNTILTISCMEYSILDLQNVNSSAVSTVSLFDHSSATLKNSTISLGLFGLSVDTHDQSTLDVEYINFIATGMPAPCFQVDSLDTSVVNIVNVTATNLALTSFNGHDLSVMSINNSNISTVGVAVKSNGAMSVTNNVLGGSFFNLTTWNNPQKPVTPKLHSIAVVGSDTATITNSNLYGVYVYLHSHANLNSQNGAISYCVLHHFSVLSGRNMTFGYVNMYDWSSASLSNITVVYSLLLFDSATMSCNGTASAPSTIIAVEAVSNFPHISSMTINNCTVTYVSGVTWIPEVLLPFPLLSYLAAILGAYLQGLLPSSTLLLIGGGLFAIIAAIVGITFWKRRP